MKLPLWVQLQRLNLKSKSNDNQKNLGPSFITSPKKHNDTVPIYQLAYMNNYK